MLCRGPRWILCDPRAAGRPGRKFLAVPCQKQPGFILTTLEGCFAGRRVKLVPPRRKEEDQGEEAEEASATKIMPLRQAVTCDRGHVTTFQDLTRTFSCNSSGVHVIIFSPAVLVFPSSCINYDAGLQSRGGAVTGTQGTDTPGEPPA